MQLTVATSYLGRAFSLSSTLFVIVAGLLMVAASHAGFMGIPLTLILLTWFFKYGLVMVEHVAWEQKEAPVLSIEMIHPLEQQKSAILLFITGMFFCIFRAAQYWLGDFVGAIVGLGAIGLLPAVMAVQSAKDSALQALDPREWVRLIRWMKGDYLLVLGCIFVYWVLGYIVIATPILSFLPLFAILAIFMFGWLAVLALLGGAIRERRLVDPDDSPMERYEEAMPPAQVAKLRERRIDSIYGEWRNGAEKNAWQTLMRTVEESGDPLEEMRWILERISGWPDKRLANRVAQELVPRLLAISRYGEALTVTRQRLVADPGYRPVTATETLRMVRMARDGGDRPTARALLRDFQTIFPNDPLQPAADELAAQLQR